MRNNYNKLFNKVENCVETFFLLIIKFLYKLNTNTHLQNALNNINCVRKYIGLFLFILPVMVDWNYKQLHCLFTIYTFYIYTINIYTVLKV